MRLRTILIVIGIGLLAINAVNLGDRTYHAWTLKDDASFAWFLTFFVCVCQFTLGYYTYMAIKWANKGLRIQSALAWSGVALAFTGAFSAAFHFELGRWSIYPLALSFTLLPPLMIQLSVMTSDKGKGAA